MTSSRSFSRLSTLPTLCRAALAVAVMVATGAGNGAAQQAKPAPVPPSAVPSVEGTWIDHTGRGAIAIERCKDRLCGRIVWLQDPNGKDGRPLTDGLNPDRARRGQPICGLQVIGDLRGFPGGVWDEGWIYDPEKGESFSLELRLKSADTLQVTGYLGVKWLSETYLWKRAAPTAPRCAAGMGAAPRSG